jgi:hypothetical protein
MFNVGKPIEPCLVSQDKNLRARTKQGKLFILFSRCFLQKKPLKTFFQNNENDRMREVECDDEEEEEEIDDVEEDEDIDSGDEEEEEVIHK